MSIQVIQIYDSLWLWAFTFKISLLPGFLEDRCDVYFLCSVCWDILCRPQRVTLYTCRRKMSVIKWLTSYREYVALSKPMKGSWAHSHPTVITLPSQSLWRRKWVPGAYWRTVSLHLRTRNMIRKLLTNGKDIFLLSVSTISIQHHPS